MKRFLHCVGIQENGEDKDMGERLLPKGEAFQTGFLITREGDAGKWEFDAAWSWEGRLPLGANESFCLCP